MRQVDRSAAVSTVFAVVVAACGGATPAPQAGGASPSPESSLNEPASPAAPEPAPTAELLAGIKAFDAGNYAEAKRSFEAASKKNPNDYEAFYNLGMTNEKLGDKPGAEAAYKAALAAKPDLDTAAAELTALYVDEGRNDDALAVGRAGLAKHPGSGPLHENLGVALASRGDQDEATKELEAAVKISPSEAMFHLTLAHWLNVWHVRGASPHLDAARDLVKDDYGMVASIGHEYRMAGDFDGCVKTFDHAVSIKDGGEVRTERALCRLGLKDDKGTMDDLQAAVSKEPGYAPAHYYLGGRLAMAQRFPEAAAEYGKYLQLEPHGSLSQAAGDRLKAAQAAAKVKGGPKKK
ncbi:MAG TPA: tetratricopeptide repeat protein [Polyangiaceae bacterium]|nr:tetratricopeptide repeat protein [Polyangiaceae bacterium]